MSTLSKVEPCSVQGMNLGDSKSKFYEVQTRKYKTLRADEEETIVHKPTIPSPARTEVAPVTAPAERRELEIAPKHVFLASVEDFVSLVHVWPLDTERDEFTEREWTVAESVHVSD
jgi:hypothetical protein